MDRMEGPFFILWTTISSNSYFYYYYYYYYYFELLFTYLADAFIQNDSKMIVYTDESH